jgi:hypothetical protein
MTIYLRFDKGWYCEYYDAKGRTFTDSEKIAHPDMPRRKDGGKKAEKIARKYAREELGYRRDEIIVVRS